MNTTLQHIRSKEHNVHVQRAESIQLLLDAMRSKPRRNQKNGPSAQSGMSAEEVEAARQQAELEFLAMYGESGTGTSDKKKTMKKKRKSKQQTRNSIDAAMCEGVEAKESLHNTLHNHGSKLEHQLAPTASGAAAFAANVVLHTAIEMCDIVQITGGLELHAHAADPSVVGQAQSLLQKQHNEEDRKPR